MEIRAFLGNGRSDEDDFEAVTLSLFTVPDVEQRCGGTERGQNTLVQLELVARGLFFSAKGFRDYVPEPVLAPVPVFFLKKRVGTFGR